MPTYTEDGILTCDEDLIENTAKEIASQSDPDKRIEMLSKNIMLYITRFGEKTTGGAVIDNNYIGTFINDLCGKLRW